MNSRDQHLFGPGPKRILALDGGGIRGLISLGILEQVETLLRERLPEAQRDAFRLCDYFDLIGGTSTGALIAVQLAMGEKVSEITQRYIEMCPIIFSRTNWLTGVSSKIDSREFEKAIQKKFRDLVAKHGHNPEIEVNLDTSLLRTGLAVVTKRIDTGSVWVQTNNPRHKFWDRRSQHWQQFWASNDPKSDFFANGSYSLRKIVQASASAPFYFDPVELDIGPDQGGVFLDGGVSPFNDPSSELFMMAALTAVNGAADGNGHEISPHGFGWPTGRDNIFVFSVGAGSYRVRHKAQQFRKKPAGLQATAALLGIIADAQKSTRTWMQAISVPPRSGDAVAVQHAIDYNLGSMRGLTLLPQPLLTYRRVDAQLEPGWLEKHLGAEFKYTDTLIDKLRDLTCKEAATHKRCLDIGQATGKRFVAAEDFPAAFDIRPAGGTVPATS
jgi:predicted acylesterase/phospholipase RssA